MAWCLIRHRVTFVILPFSVRCSRLSFATVHFVTIHFYDSCQVRWSTSNLWCITVSNSSDLSLLIALLAVFWCAHVSSFSILVQLFWVDCDFSTQWCPSKRQKRRKNQNSWHYILSWCLLNHGLSLLQQNKKWFDRFFFSHLCNFLYSKFINLKLVVKM
jgi:hypothetical protein